MSERSENLNAEISLGGFIQKFKSFLPIAPMNWDSRNNGIFYQL
jgi:hypothetical protein